MMAESEELLPTARVCHEPHTWLSTNMHDTWETHLGDAFLSFEDTMRQRVDRRWAGF